MELNPLGDRELEVMGLLWQTGSGTVNEIRDLIDVELAYTTVLTILRNLEAKGFLEHLEEGRAHRFFPSIPRSAVVESATTRLLTSLFGGSAEALVLQLVDRQHLDAAALSKLARQVNRPKHSANASAERPESGEV